jgi:F-type H+-transporting ATPase subunit b
VDNPIVQPDPGLFIWTILTFLVLLALLAKFAWKPLLEALEKRQQTIESAVENARAAAAELDRVRSETAGLLSEARREADGVITRARADAERFREETRQQAAREAAGIVSNAERQIERETTKAIARIKEEAVDLSLDVASKILGRVVSKDDHERLVNEVVRQIDSPRM